MYSAKVRGSNACLEHKVLDSNRNFLDTNTTYGSLPSKFRSHNRHFSDTGRSLSSEEHNKSVVTKTRKTSVFAGLASKLRQTFDGSKPTAVPSNLHRPLRVSLSDFGGCGSVEYLGSDPRPFRRQSSIKFATKLFQKSSLSKQRSQESTKTNRSLNQSYLKPRIHTPDNLSLPCSPEFYRTQSCDERQRAVLRRDKFVASNSSDNLLKPQDNRKFDKAQQNNRSETHKSSLNPISSSEEKVEMKLIVMGSERVGKSAIVVRFLTKRFIGEYVPKVESVNSHDFQSTTSGNKIRVHIWDSTLPEIIPPLTPDALYDGEASPGENMFQSMSSSSSSSSLCEFPEEFEENAIDEDGTEENIKALERLEWADGIVLVYNICNKDSFRCVQNMVRFIRGHTHADSDDFRRLRQSVSTPNHRNTNRDSGFLSGTGSRPNSGSCETSPTSVEPSSPNKPPLSQMPIILLGNKLDLQHRREVSTTECQVFASSYGCMCRELSASDGFEPISNAFEEIIDAAQKNTMPSTITRIRTMVRKIRHRRNKST